jgi:hypothetical protein
VLIDPFEALLVKNWWYCIFSHLFSGINGPHVFWVSGVWEIFMPVSLDRDAMDFKAQ